MSGVVLGRDVAKSATSGFSRDDGGSGSFRPSQQVPATANEEELNQIPIDHEFSFETTNIADFSSIMYAMRDLVGDLRIHAGPKGMEINELVANQNLMVSLFIDGSSSASPLDSYVCHKEIVLCFHPKLMYDQISRHKKSSLMRWELRREKRTASAKVSTNAPDTSPVFHYLHVVCSSVDEATGTEYEHKYNIPLVRSFQEVHDGLKNPCDYMLMLHTNVLVNEILATFGELTGELSSRWVRITCTNNLVIFSMTGGSDSSVPMAAFVIRTVDADEKYNPDALREVLTGPTDAETDENGDLVNQKYTWADITSKEQAGEGSGEADGESELPPPVSKGKRGAATRDGVRADVTNSARTVADESTRPVLDNHKVVDAQFSLVYLLLIKKCLSINGGGFVKIFLTEGTPLIASVSTGLGDLYCTVMFRDVNDTKDLNSA